MHLSFYQINRYRYACLTPMELLAVDDHLATCEFCRQQLRSGLNVPAALQQLHANLQVVAESEHLPPAQCTAFVHNRLDAVERELVTSHLEECRSCAAQVQFLQQEAVASVPTPAEMLASLWAFLHERAALLWPMPVAALLVVVSVTLIDQWWLRRSAEATAPTAIQPHVEPLAPTPSVSPSPVRTLPAQKSSPHAPTQLQR
jgi:anti-sigma factor RsiW